MLPATISLDGTGGEVLLLAYIIGGIVLAASALLPGNSAGWRVVSVVLGLGFAIWAAYVLFFGGWIIISAKVLLFPIILVVRSIVAAVRRSKATPASPMGQIPQFNGPAGYQPPPTAGAYGPPNAAFGQPAAPYGPPAPGAPFAPAPAYGQQAGGGYGGGQPGSGFGAPAYGAQPGAWSGQPGPGPAQPGPPGQGFAAGPQRGQAFGSAAPGQPGQVFGSAAPGQPGQVYGAGPGQPSTYGPGAGQPPTYGPGPGQPAIYGQPAAQPVSSPPPFEPLAPAGPGYPVTPVYQPPAQTYQPPAPQGPAAFNSTADPYRARHGE